MQPFNRTFGNLNAIVLHAQRAVLICLAAALVSLPLGAAAQAKPDYDMGRMQLVFMLATTPIGAAQDAQYRKETEALLLAGKLAAAGPATGAGRTHSMLLVKTDDAQAALTLVNSLSAVREGLLKPDPITWYAARAYVKPVSAADSMTRYVFGLLVSAGATGHSPDELKAIQAGHMAHIGKMAETGKLVLAGPFANPDHRRGVFLFKLPEQADAQALAADDPAIKAGRLRLETFFWTVPAGVFP